MASFNFDGFAIENYILFRAFSKDAEPASAERVMAYGKSFYG